VAGVGCVGGGRLAKGASARFVWWRSLFVSLMRVKFPMTGLYKNVLGHKIIGIFALNMMGPCSGIAHFSTYSC
jgi:fluoride ion exporter CrcB/FEX